MALIFDTIDWSVSSNTGREIWRRVFDFANADVAEAAIVERHGPPQRDGSDYRKQTRQIRVSLLQAREFFAAAEQATLFTSPNHLYYGMVSLCSAIMLLNGTGERSLDYLRKNPANANHGLKFTISLSEGAAKKNCEILDNARVEVREAGHFRNWYESLPSVVRTYGRLTETTASFSVVRGGCIGTALMEPFERFRRRPALLSELFRLVPDLIFDFWRYKLGTRATTAQIDCTRRNDAKRSRTRFALASASSSAELEAVLNAFKFPPSSVDALDVTCVAGPNGQGAVVIIEVPNGTNYWMPEIRSTLDEQFVVFGDEFSRPEIADAYRAAYGLSMLSRYYPDLWMACLESHCFSAKLIQRFVETYVEKFPALALEYLVGHKVVVSTRPAPWLDDVL